MLLELVSISYFQCGEKGEDGNLAGTLEIPLAIGTVGGATKTHPIARIALKILGLKSVTLKALMQQRSI